jgi:hypothetical protein
MIILKSEEKKSKPKVMNILKSNKKPKESNIRGYDFKCGCGKLYKSYYALYNHAKTIHGGILPAGSTDLTKVITSKNESKKDKKIIYLFKKYEKFNKEFIMFLESVPGSQDPFDENRQELLNDFPLNTTDKDFQRIALYDVIKTLSKKFEAKFGKKYFQKMEYIIHEKENKANLSCTEVMGLFLIYIYKFVSPDFYQEICQLIILYLKMLDLKGWEQCKELVPNFKVPQEISYCESQSAELVPDFANTFVLQFFPDFMKSKPELKNKFIFFGIDPICFLRTVIFVKHLSKWICISELSKADIEILKD